MTIFPVFWKAFLAVIFTMATVRSTLAQPEDPIWFWVWRSYDLDVEKSEDQRGDLLAFTPDGTVNVLLENIFPIFLQRIDDDGAFVVGKIDEAYRLYYLTSTQAIQVVELFDQDYVDEFRSMAIYDGYSYFAPEIIPAGEDKFLIADTKRNQYTVFDTEQHNTISVDLRAWCKDDCVRVSADGRYIRYRVSPSDPMQSRGFPDPGEDDLPYQIYEFDVVAGSERLIYEQTVTDFVVTPPQADCTPDQYGDRWYCELFLDDGNNPIWVSDEKIIVYADGTTEPVNPDWKLRVLENRWYFLDLDRVRDDCDRCVINVFPDGNEAEGFQFDIPPREEFAFWYGAEMLSEYHLTPGLNATPIRALSRSGEVTELGRRPCCADPIGQDFYDPATGWLVLINASDPDNAHTEIWNTRPLGRIASFSANNIQPGVRSTFRDYSLVLFDRSPGGGPAVAYSYIDEVLYEFDFIEYRRYIDAFAGGVLVVDLGDDYWNDRTFAVANDGIYRWTPTEGETLLIDGAVSVPEYWK